MPTISSHNPTKQPDYQTKQRSPSQGPSRRSSVETSRQASISRSRVNSMSNTRRLSRARSRQEFPESGQNHQLDAPIQFNGTMHPAVWDVTDPTYDLFFDDVCFTDPFATAFAADYVGANRVQTDAYAVNQVREDQWIHDLVPSADYLAQEVPGISPRSQQPARCPVHAPSNNVSIDPLLLDPNLANGQSMDQQSQIDWSQVTYSDANIDPVFSATPGLTAVPSDADLEPQYNPYLTNPGYHEVGAPQFQPYYVPFTQTGYSITEPHIVQPQVPESHFNSGYEPNKRALSYAGVEDCKPNKKLRTKAQDAGDSSDDELFFANDVKALRFVDSDEAHRGSLDSSSSNSSLDKPNKTTIAKVGQKPQKMDEKPWIRINNNTKGETTRTARINGEANEIRRYKHKPLPNGDWRSTRYKFEYTSNGELDEFKKKKMSARQIQEYIMEYPTGDLRLWLQVSPADMARRYGSPGHSKCLFEDCPKHVWGDSGTIDVGHYRVAFDEKFKRHGNKVVDPFDCPGFVHLHCLERFLDFEAICRHADVQVDTRVDLPREAGQAKWTLSGRPETEIAQFFLKAAKKRNSVRDTTLFQYYPVHVSSSTPKIFEHTLVYKLAQVNIQHRTRSQMRQFVDRRLTPNVFMINKGDLEIAMTQKKIKASKAYKKALKNKRATAATFNFEAFYDQYDPIINIRIQEYRNLKAQYDAQDAAGLAPKKGKPTKSNATTSRKRKAAIRDDSSDSELDLDSDSDDEILEVWTNPQQSPATQAVRVSPRKKQRINYAVDDLPEHPNYAPVQQQVQSTTHYHPTTTQPIEQDYLSPQQSGRLNSASHLFPKDILGNSTLDLDNVSAPTSDLSQGEIDAILKSLERRKSSTISNGPVMQNGNNNVTFPIGAHLHSSSAGSYSARNTGRITRQASFAAQPVTQSKEFRMDDPPVKVAGGVDGCRRMSARLASKMQ